MSALHPISTPDAPAPAGHYAQAIACGGFLFVSGQLPLDPATKAPVGGSLADQTRRVLENVAAIVRAGGSDVHRIVKMTLYVSDISGWASVNEVYADFFGDHRPARAVIPVGELHHGVGIEVEAVAALA